VSKISRAPNDINGAIMADRLLRPVLNSDGKPFQTVTVGWAVLKKSLNRAEQKLSPLCMNHALWTGRVDHGAHIDDCYKTTVDPRVGVM